MKSLTKSTLACLLLAVWSYGCSDDSTGTSNQPDNSGLNIGDACQTGDICPDGSVCANGVCTEESDPCAKLDCKGECKNGKCVNDEDEKLCGGKKCGENQKCKDDRCVDLCGGEICKDGFICVDNTCTEETPDPLCGETTCTDAQTCLNEVCHESGDCGGLACLENEVCHNDVCHIEGDCGGLTCNENETCDDDTCKIAGDCNGIACADDEICYFDGCRKIGDCAGVACNDNEFCYRNDYCKEKVLCGETYCDVNYECVDGTCQPSDICSETDEAKCGDACCGLDEFCGKRTTCCPVSEACGQDCCQSGEVCDHEMCHIACEENIERCMLENGTEVCCAEGEICTSNQCFKPTTSCVDNYMCDNGQYCDPEMKTCLPIPKTAKCEATPKGGEVQPTLLWYWGEVPPDPFPDYAQVMSSPMVADINNDTIPEVAFNSYQTGDHWEGHAILRVLNGQTGKLLASSDGNPKTDGGSQVAVGNLDDDPMLEIVTCADNYRLIAYKYVKGDAAAGTVDHLEVMWHSNAAFMECGQSGPGIADFNGDGKPEVYGRYTIHDGRTGEVLAHVACDDGTHTHRACDYSVALDIDEDGKLELVGGNVVFTVDLDQPEIADRLKPLWHRADQPDGYPAVANIDADPKGIPELVVVRNSSATLMAYNARTGENFWAAPVSYSVQGGGTPTISNLNDTPELEISFAGSLGNIALNYKGETLWTRGSNDTSSGRTGSSVFDFDGDGKAEVVYADEYYLRVYDGETGKTRFCQCNTNCTHYEYPVIADVDADGHAEILISANTSCGYTKCKTDLTEALGKDECVDAIIASAASNPDILKGQQGVRAFASPTRDWINTRKIYNQHAYNVTNISDNGSLPTKVRDNWTTQGLNNFRLNVQPGATYLPDLEIRDISSPYNCTAPIPIYFVVANVGWATAPAGITIHVWASDKAEGPYTEVGTANTTETIRANDATYVTFDYTPTSSEALFLQFTFGDDAPVECNSDNNKAAYQIICPVN